MNHSVAIIGGGPAGLMAAEVLNQHGVKVDVYDSMSSLGRKFLMAGKGGLNLTHSESFEQFVPDINAAHRLEAWLKDFRQMTCVSGRADSVSKLLLGHREECFREMKASPLLRAWLKRLADAGINFIEA